MDMTDYNCVCRDWSIAGGDLVISSVAELPDVMKDWNKIHDCQQVTVYQMKGHIKRLYFKKHVQKRMARNDSSWNLQEFESRPSVEERPGMGTETGFAEGDSSISEGEAGLDASNFDTN